MSAIGDAPDQAGFTLLEMLVTLAISALIAGLAFPAMQRGIDHMAFVRATSEAGAALRMARAMAIARGGEVDLAVGADGRLVAAGRPLSAVLPQGISISLAPAPVAFFADGTARAADVRLSSPRDQWRAHIDASGQAR